MKFQNIRILGQVKLPISQSTSEVQVSLRNLIFQFPFLSSLLSSRGSRSGLGFELPDHLLGVLLVHAAVGLLLEDDLAVDPHHQVVGLSKRVHPHFRLQKFFFLFNENSLLVIINQAAYQIIENFKINQKYGTYQSYKISQVYLLMPQSSKKHTLFY